MSNFKGYLLSFKGKTLSNEYISFKSYKVHPNQRLEIKAYRDANGLLHRVTVPNYKSKIEIETIGGLTLDKKEKLFAEINNGHNNPADKVQRRYQIEYWNDEDENYKTGTFYIVDPEITIRKISENNIIYEPIKLSFIEY